MDSTIRHHYHVAERHSGEYGDLSIRQWGIAPVDILAPDHYERVVALTRRIATDVAGELGAEMISLSGPYTMIVNGSQDSGTWRVVDARYCAYAGCLERGVATVLEV